MDQPTAQLDDRIELSDIPDLPDTVDLLDDIAASVGGVEFTIGEAQIRAAPRAAPQTVVRSVTPDLVPRVLAKLIDGTVAGVLYTVCTVVVADWFVGFLLGGVAASAYLLLSDGLDLETMPRRSFGKKTMGLTVTRLDEQPMTVSTSMQRNWMFALLYFVQAFTFAAPAVSVLLLLAALGLVGYEVYWVATSPGGVRWGDDIAGTEVLQTVVEPA